jgi:hypothetical protein
LKKYYPKLKQKNEIEKAVQNTLKSGFCFTICKPAKQYHFEQGADITQQSVSFVLWAGNTLGRGGALKTRFISP